MKNLKEKIAENLIIKVDFNVRFKKSTKNTKQITSFCLIGSLPVLIKFKNGEDKTIRLNRAVQVRDDPNLRRMQGLFAVDPKITGKYKKLVLGIVHDLSKMIKKILKDNKFNNQDIQKIVIVKIKDERSKKGNNGKSK